MNEEELVEKFKILVFGEEEKKYTETELEYHCVSFSEQIVRKALSYLTTETLQIMAKDFITQYILGKVDGEKGNATFGFIEIIKEIFEDRDIIPILAQGVRNKYWPSEDAINAMINHVTLKAWRTVVNQKLYAEVEQIIDNTDLDVVMCMYWCLAVNETQKIYKQFSTIDRYMEEIVFGPMKTTLKGEKS